MEQSKYDLSKALSQMRVDKDKSMSFLDVLGADLDSSFTKPL